MTAFVSFVRAYAIWIYLLCAFGALLGVKMLTDARRLARTTLFSLEQERAREQSYRAIILIGVLLASAVVATIVNVVGGAIVPAPESPILRGATPTLSAIVFPTNTPSPTLTGTPPPASETPFLTSTPAITATATRAVRPTALAASLTPPAFPFPAPTVTGPIPNGGTWTGEGQASNNIVFRWTCDQCALGPNDSYEVTITYTDKSGAPKSIAGRTQDKFLSLRRILDGGPFEIYQKAKDNTYQWYVQIKRDPGDQPISPQSEVWKFTWL